VASFTSVDTRLNPMAVVDLSMRSAGKYLTPPIISGQQVILSVPGIGSCLPEVGAFLSGPSTNLNLTSPWPTQLPTVDVAQSTSITNCASFACASPIKMRPTYAVDSGLNFEGFFYLSRPASRTGFLVLGDESATNEVQVCVEPGGQISLRNGTGTPFYTSTTVFIPSGAATWNYIGVHLLDPAWSSPVFVFGGTVGGGTVFDGPATATAFVTPDGLSNVRLNCTALGLQVFNSDTAAFNNFAWTPNYTAYLSTQPARIYGLARQSASAWATIQQVAKAYGDVAWFDGAGVFHYETRATWKARRYGGAARTLTEFNSGILSGLPDWGAQGVCRSVSANVVTPQVTQSTAASPAFTATEVYTVAARTTSTIQIDLDYQIYDVKPVAAGVAAGASFCYFYPVRADAVGDPAATMIGLVGVTITPNSTGIAVTIRNSNSVAISLWEPSTLGPYLIVHGKKITFPDPKTLTRSAGSTGSDLPLEDNPWRQDATAAAAWLDDIAQEVAYPQVVWSGLQGVVDPRRSIGDVLALNDGRHMDVTHPAQIVGTNFNLPAGGLHTLDYTVRTAYPPTGLIVGVSSMTVGSSTMLVRA
jgi:hypothetical protein